MPIVNDDGFGYLADVLNGLIPSCFAFNDSILSKEGFISHVLFWAYKSVYTDNARRKSFAEHTGLKLKTVDANGHYINNIDYERDNQKYRRALLNAAKRKEEDSRRNGTQADYFKDLLTKEKLGKEPRSSYHYSNLVKITLDLLNPQTGLQLLSLLRDGRIPNSKKVSSYDIEDANIEYYRYLTEAGSRKLDSTVWIENLINLSSVESQMLPSLLFEIACFMEINNLSFIPREMDVLYSLFPVSPSGGIVESRFLGVRNKLVPILFQNDRLSFEAYNYIQQLLLLQYSVLEQFRKETLGSLEAIKTDEAKRFFEKRYNLFEACPSSMGKVEIWSSSLVKRYRYVVETLTITEKGTANLATLFLD